MSWKSKRQWIEKDNSPGVKKTWKDFWMRGRRWEDAKVGGGGCEYGGRRVRRWKCAGMDTEEKERRQRRWACGLMERGKERGNVFWEYLVCPQVKIISFWNGWCAPLEIPYNFTVQQNNNYLLQNKRMSWPCMNLFYTGCPKLYFPTFVFKTSIWDFLY